MSNGHMPFLKEFSKNNNSGKVKAFLPTFVFPNWSSFWTGTSPAHNEIFSLYSLPKKYKYDFKLASTKQFNNQNWITKHSNKNRIVTMLNPLNYPSFNGCYATIPDQHLMEIDKTSYPPNLSEILSRLEVPKSSQFFPPNGLNSIQEIDLFIEKQTDNIINNCNVSLNIAKKCSADVMCLHFFATDPLQHVLWHGIDEDHSQFDEKLRLKLTPFFKAIDNSLKDLLEVTHAKETLMFSLHGFQPVDGVIDLSKTIQSPQLGSSFLCSEDFLPIKVKKRGIRKFIQIFKNTAKKILKPYLVQNNNIFLDVKAIYVKKNKSMDRNISILRKKLTSLIDEKNNAKPILELLTADDLYGIKPKNKKWEVLIPIFSSGYTARNKTNFGEKIYRPQIYKEYLSGTHTHEGIWLCSNKENTINQKELRVNDIYKIIEDIIES